MKRAACVLLPLLLWACEPASLPAPAILSVEPEQIPHGSPSALSVRVSTVVPVSVDYQEQAVEPEPVAMTLHIAGQVAEIAFADLDGTLVAAVPEGLSLGAYDIQVTLADGRDAVREQAFSVVPPSLFTGGTPPGRDGGTEADGGSNGGTPGTGEESRVGITGFRIDPIRDQVRNTPFKVTIRALGPEASTFQAPVSLRASRGKVTTRTLGSFVDGTREEEISLSHPGSRIYLLIEDKNGRKGLSNSFRVRPH